MFSCRSERVECYSCYYGVGYYSQSHLWLGLAVRLHTQFDLQKLDDPNFTALPRIFLSKWLVCEVLISMEF
jgi:hypothetical protein